jgi:hypothetical protein
MEAGYHILGIVAWIDGGGLGAKLEFELRSGRVRMVNFWDQDLGMTTTLDLTIMKI